MTKTIYFDMDGTFVNLYGVEDWLDMLINEDTKPYAIAKPLFRMCEFARIIHKLQINGYRIGIISWLSKNGTDEYNEILKDELYTLQVFSKNQKESEMIISILNNYKVKYYAIESKID